MRVFVCSIVETEVLWHAFNEDCDNLDTKLTSAERDLSHFKVKGTTFQQMKDMLPRLKVTHARNCLNDTNFKFFLLYSREITKMAQNQNSPGECRKRPMC